MRKQFYPPVDTLFISNLHTFTWKKHIYIDGTMKKISTINFDYQSRSDVYTLTVTCKSKKVRNLLDLHSHCCSGEKKGREKGGKEGTKERRTERRRHFPSSATKVLCNTGWTNTEELSSAEFMQCACMHFHSPFTWVSRIVNVKRRFIPSVCVVTTVTSATETQTSYTYTYLIYVYNVRNSQSLSTYPIYLRTRLVPN